MALLSTIRQKNHDYTFTFPGERGEDIYVVPLDPAEIWNDAAERIIKKLPKVSPISCLMNNRFFFQTLLQMPPVLHMEIYDYTDTELKIKVFQKTDEYRVKLSMYYVKKIAN